MADRDPDVHIYDSDQLNDGITAVVNLGKVPGYAISEDGTEITPEFTPSTDSIAYARVIYHTAKLFAVGLTSSSFRTRAFSESFGDSRELISDLLNEVYQLENGEQSA